MEEKRIMFNRSYDDPYRVLATHLMSICSPKTIQRIMTSSSFVKSAVIREAKKMDVSGAFLDCIDQEIMTNDHLRKKNVYLKKLGEFYYSELDLPRLRKEIRIFAEELGIPLD